MQSMLGYEGNEMSLILTEAELQVVLAWERSRASQYRLDDNPKNVELIIPVSRSKAGGITPRNLDEAVQISLPSLTFMPGHEPEVVKRRIAKAAADQAQQKKDANELERKRKRDAEVKAGVGPNQSKIKTESDRYEAKAAADTQTVALTGVNHPAFIQQNLEAKAQFEDLVSRGPITYRNNREDRAKTEERRAELQGLTQFNRFVAAQRDRKGQQVLIYSKLVEEAQQIVARFEQEDSLRES